MGHLSVDDVRCLAHIRTLKRATVLLGSQRKNDAVREFLPLEPFSARCNHFRPRRHLLPAHQYRQLRTERFQQWRDAARLAPAA